MMEEWKEYKLGAIANFQKGFAFKSSEYTRTGTRIIKVSNLNQDKYSDKDCVFIDKEKALSYEKYRIVEGDIVISTVGSWPTNPESVVGKVSLIRSSLSGSLLNQNAVRLRVAEGMNQRFLYYLLMWPEFGNYITNTAQGSANQASITLEDIRNFKFNCPNFYTQDKIASILKSLDDKIEVNRKINENLEQQAQALFKSWFVDFEPFKNGEFVESELGMIPKGWRVGKLGELCQFKRGKGLLSKNAIPGDVPVVAGGLEPACYHNISNTKAPVITVSGSGANAGFMRMYHQEVWASDCSFIDITCENWLFVYCFLAINSHLLKHAQTGAVQPHVKPADIHDFDLVIPPKVYIQRFQDKISSFITKKGLIEQESRRLAELRDTLLPKLMSGQIEVNEI